MCAWGVAMAQGPHINFPMVPPPRAEAAAEAIARAQVRLTRATPVERALVTALATRHAAPPPEDRKPLDAAYAEAMRKVWKAHPRDADVGALFAEALMDLRPWDQWTREGEPQPGTEEVVATLEKVMKLSPRHPLALHLYIHAVEASAHPERADVAADRLRQLQPGLGHMVHMPSHVDVRRGRWHESIAADRAYREKSQRQDFYRVYMAHNHHMLTWSAMMTGQRELSVSTMREFIAAIPKEWAQENAGLIDGYYAMPAEVLVRFGRWDEVLAEPEPAEAFPLARALWRAARGVAYAAQGKTEEARAEQRAFTEARARVKPEAAFGNNPAGPLLDVAGHLLAGELLVREGKREEALAELRKGVEVEDTLRYDEPPDWVQPVRHTLGAALLQMDRAPEAEAVYRADLERLPNNVWSLHGLGLALRMQKKTQELKAVEAELAKQGRAADIKLTSSCLCLPVEPKAAAPGP